MPVSKAVRDALKKERNRKTPFVIPKAKTKTKTKTKTKINNSKAKPKTKYEACKTNIIGQDMRLFKQGKLKQRNKQPVTSRKQAIAIALSMAEKKCKDKKTLADVRKENKKIRRKLSAPLKPVDIRNIIAKLKELKKKKRSREYRTLKINLLSQILMSPSITPEMTKDIKRYLRNE
jgi:hypothetical protein